MVAVVAEAQQILDALDPEQRRVATTLEGPVVVLAGAGTGKTRAMTHRLAHGVLVGAFSPTATLAVTFTTRAAGELRGRLRALGVGGVQARTFHSAALRQAQYFWPRAYGADLPPVADNRYAIVAEALRRERLTPDTGLMRDISGEVSWAKVSNVSAADYASVAESHHRSVSGRTHDEVGRLLARYEAVKQARGVIDFDDILLCTAALLSDNAEVLDEVRRAYQHFVVDEYQDVSPLQQTLLDLWLGGRDDLCVVGDPAQTIHSFAGAQASFLTGFRHRHPRATQIELVRDYRSTPQVVGLANAVMRGRREAVTLRSERRDGPAPLMVGARSEADEASEVATWLRGLASAGVPWHEMAVLHRVHAQSPPLEAALSDAGIPFATRGSEGFFERAEVRQALRQFQLSLKAEASETPDVQFAGVLAGLGHTPEPPAGQGSARERWESWSALVSLAENWTAAHPAATASDLAAELDARAHARHAPVGAGVTLSTLHAAKGLEWDAVAIVGVHEGGLPFVLATTPEQVAEERRLLYVGVTRAREYLRLSWSHSRSGNGSGRPASRFLDGLVPREQRAVTPARRTGRGVRSAMSATCRVCGGSLGTGAERKLGRHLACEGNVDESMWEALRAWRKATADAQSAPAFVVFTDATLLAIAEARPATLSELAKISGVGATKLDRYGEAVLAIVSEGSDSSDAEHGQSG